MKATMSPLNAAKATKKILLMGQPGSGKLVQAYDISFVSTGDVLRREIAAKSEVGKKAEAIVASGGFVGDNLMLELVQTELERLKGKSWVLDGFPRTFDQGRLLHEAYNDEASRINMIVKLNVPDSVILRRIQARWVHLPSGRVYNDDFNPPKVPGKDDVTGEPLSKRPDDTPEVFSKRLQSYYAETAPLMEYFSQVYPDDVHSLSGSTSDEIWPKLQALVDAAGLVHRKKDLPPSDPEVKHTREEADDLRDQHDIPVGDKVAHVH